MNDAIKNAIRKYLENHGYHTEENREEFYDGLLNDINQVSTLRKDLDTAMIELKREIIKSNIILLFDYIFKDNNEKVVEILNNTHDPKIFYGVADALNKLLITFNQYSSNYSFNAGEVKEIKESFVLTDNQLKELITEINLDNK
jgi:hypothetical protein